VKNQHIASSVVNVLLLVYNDMFRVIGIRKVVLPSTKSAISSLCVYPTNVLFWY